MIMILRVFLPYQEHPCFIETNEQQILNYCFSYFGMYCSISERYDDFVISVSKIDNRYFIETKFGGCITEQPKKIIVDLVDRTGGICSDSLLFHGMCVFKDGKTFLFLAPTHSGKSTLAAILSANNYRILSEDTVVIEKLTGLLVPVFLPIRLREGGKSVFLKETHSCNMLPEINDGTEMRFLINLKTENCDRKYTINSIFFLKYGMDNSYNYIASPFDRFLLLLNSTKTYNLFTSDSFSLLKLLTLIDAYKLDYSDSQFVMDLLNSLTE